jgi:hypothetical protein
MNRIQKIIQEILQEKKVKRDRCLRIADRKFDKPSAYKSGAVVRCRKGDIWKGLKEEILSNLTKIEPYNDPDDEYSQDLDDYLEDDNIDWRKESYITLLNPNQIQPSEWNSLSNDPKNPKSIKYSKIDPSKFPPILALKIGPNSYEAIDGIHRVYAFRLNNHMVPAVVITPKLEQGLSTNDTQMVNFMFNKYKDSNIPTPTKINNLKEETTSTQSSIQKIDQLPQGKLFNDAKNIEGIFKKSPHSWSEVIELFEKNKDKSKPEVINIKDIYVTQPNIQANKVKNMLDKVNNLLPINVVEFEDGEKVIYDAHHRLVANWALGNDKIKVNLVKINNLKEEEIKNLKVYHSTDSKFKDFSLDHAWDGFWFTNNINVLKNKEAGAAGNKYIMTRYITLTNPAGWDEYDKYSIGELIDEGYDGVILPEDNRIDYLVFDPKSISKNIKETNDPQSGKAAPYGSGYAKLKDIIKEIIQEDESLRKWFKRSGTPGKEGGWVDCNSPIRKDGKITGYKSCGRKKGEKRSKYPSCRPTAAKCKDKGKGTKWGKTK